MTTEVSRDLSVSVLEQVANFVDTVEDRAPEEISQAIKICDFLQAMFAESRRSIGEFLAQGVDAKEFATKYEKALNDLGPTLTGIDKIIAHFQNKSLTPPADECVSRFKDLMDEVLGLYHFIRGAVDKAKLPHPPTDWARIEEARNAYERGETKPFQRLVKS
ncbi:MAG TPA: hypothetical protein VK395_29995 [Gemmataceae bacterium]|nr:hypothetical protein [Gemmataceae bacterium]